MSSAMGLLRWSPEQFRGATFYEFTAAMKGYLASKGSDMEAPMTRNEFLDLAARDKKKEQRGND